MLEHLQQRERGDVYLLGRVHLRGVAGRRAHAPAALRALEDPLQAVHGAARRLRPARAASRPAFLRSSLPVSLATAVVRTQTASLKSGQLDRLSCAACTELWQKWWRRVCTGSFRVKACL